MAYFIFDLDGTLYDFEPSRSCKGKGGFINSLLWADVSRNVEAFIARTFELKDTDAKAEFKRIMAASKGEISIYLDKNHGIDRHEYYAATWNLEPAKYLKADPIVHDLFKKAGSRSAVLTAAPRIWAQRVLEHLGIYCFVKDSLFTGEPDLRKPDPAIFLKVASHLGAKPSEIFSVGDQEQTDILPAKSIGMRTIIVGSQSPDADYCVQNISELYKLMIKEGLL